MTEMQGAFEVHRMPSGEYVYYRDSDHAYYSRIEQRNDRWVGPKDAYLPSPSTIGKRLDTNTEGLIRWAAKMTCQGVVQLDNIPSDGDDLWGALNAHKLTYAHLRDQRGAEGTNVHKRILEALAAGNRVPSLADISAQERGYGQGVLAAWHDLAPDPITSEQVVYSSTYRYAGRVDLICHLDAERVVIDLKTGFVGNSAHAQLAGYILAASESQFGPIDRGLILKVAQDGSYSLIECAAGADDFLAALSAYRSAKYVTARAKVAA